MKKKILIAMPVILIPVILIIIQFFRIDKSTPEINIMDDFITITQPSDSVKLILNNACYDCHSYNTNYPWYSNVAPFSWFIGNHIEDGRRHLNFAIWGSYKSKKQEHKLEECIEEIQKGEMPIKSYTWTHPESNLSETEQKLLIDFFKSKM